MIRILLADDEPLILKGLRKLIDWEALGMEIVGQAGDGGELLELLESLRPDLIISDISMPHLSGIDIIKRINERGLPVKVVFISAYQEFSYARDAVAFGAVDYLVKPIRKPQLEQVLRKAALLINEQQEEERRKGKLKLYERKVRQEELEEGIGRLIDGTLPPASETVRLLTAELKGPRFGVGIAEAELGGESDKWSEKEKKLVDFAMGNVLQEAIGGSGVGHVFRYNGRLAFICSAASPEEWTRLASDLHRSIRTFLKLSAAIGIGRLADSAAGLPAAYREAEQALGMTYFVGLGRVIAYEPPAPTEAARSANEGLDRHQRRVTAAYAAGDANAVREELDRMLEAIRAAALGNRPLAVATCFSAMTYIVQELGKQGLLEPERAAGRQELQTRLDALPSFDRLKEEIAAIAEELFRAIEAESGNKDNAVMAKVKQYMDDHYAEDVTLESAAGVSFMNPSYFSYFFKKHTGQNFKQYVTEVRMKEAVRLLLRTDLMVYEIAERVGYNNARHFSDLFRRIYGQLPNDYRQAKSRQE